MKHLAITVVILLSTFQINLCLADTREEYEQELTVIMQQLIVDTGIEFVEALIFSDTSRLALKDSAGNYYPGLLEDEEPGFSFDSSGEGLEISYANGAMGNWVYTDAGYQWASIQPSAESAAYTLMLSTCSGILKRLVKACKKACKWFSGKADDVRSPQQPQSFGTEGLPAIPDQSVKCPKEFKPTVSEGGRPTHLLDLSDPATYDPNNR